MRNAYSYMANIDQTDILCIFFDQANLKITETMFYDELQKSLKTESMLPDYVAIIAEKKLLSELIKIWGKAQPLKTSFIERSLKHEIQFIKNYVFIALNPKSEPTIEHKELHSNLDFLNKKIIRLLELGANNLIKKNPVVQISPSGHVFRHPSKTLSNIFIQTREIAKNEVELKFIAWNLALKMNELKLHNLYYVYIDTMGIYSFVRSALTINEDNNTIIKSFHSYEDPDFQNLSPPSESYALIISASTTGGMVSKLNARGFILDRIVTIIDLCKTRDDANILIGLDEIDSLYKKRPINGSETQIELIGEHFSSKAKPPKAITLGVAHFPKNLGKFLRHFGLGNCLEINTQTLTTNKPLPIYLNGNKVYEKFCTNMHNASDWLKEEVSWCVPTGINLVLHTNDPGSKELAGKVQSYISEIKKSESQPVVIGYDEINDHKEELQIATGILIVQAVVGDGGLLREISRDLRELLTNEIPRHFLIGVGLPKNDLTWTQLKQFLVRNASSREYGFSTYLTLTIGENDNLNFNFAETISKKVGSEPMNASQSSLDRSIIDESLDLVKELLGANTLFLPTPNKEPLKLSAGFVFFSDVFEESELSDIADGVIYATIASVLQSARDITDEKNKLQSTGYESVVLAPENFLRFNDNILQACILRAAKPSELDYSSSPDYSKLMKEFLLKVFKRHNEAYGESALEFAAALASNKLKLTETDTKAIQDSFLDDLAKSKPSELLGLIYLIDKNLNT